ncbi:Stage II sporulation protein E (SpoIIE) [Pseudobutyrivibrio sp. YE44]|uniref:PP2C family protein-serine/threonine phosphatase n=1 Tax=Pseudobutyrivibrio sp. YE44 TaxID=1520802 RepID=UPI00088C0F7A|nr:PP2C family protein-serine/threonine phosphatase [Pseudobutyrivibrio sp. YE44]SDB50766.1 Stage II sporulation protein E (SpoIIE) [Pseudobutyrivibrio sp. YE44]
MGEASVKKIIWSTTIRTALFLCVALVVPALAFQSGLKGANPYHVISISADIASMLTGYVLLLGLYVDRQKNGLNAHYLNGLIISTYMAAFADAIAWIVQDEPDFIITNYVINTVYYISLITGAIFFWKYTLTYLKVKNRRIYLANILVNIFYAISLLLIFLNLKFGFYFTVDSNGTYIRSPWNELSMVYSLCLIFLSLIVVVVERKQLKPLQIFAFFVYASGPLIASGLTITAFGLSLNPSSAMLSILLMYCALNVTQGVSKVVADKEISIASSIQENVLPKVFPYLPERKEFDIYAVMKPAKDVGGDFYDFFMVDDNHLALVIADVSGKGIPAALFMMNSRTLIKNRVMAGDRLSDILEDVNNQLCEGNVADLFVTLWIGIIELSTGKGVAVNAGHEHPLLKRANGQYEFVIYHHDLAVALFEGQTFKERDFQLYPGDSIFVYTDGVTEAINDEDELFTKERLASVLNDKPNSSPKESIQNVLEAIHSFAKDVEQFDDITMLAMTYYGS